MNTQNINLLDPKPIDAVSLIQALILKYLHEHWIPKIVKKNV